MSRSSGRQIECRNCEELVPADSENCHHCGTSVRSTTGPALAILLGSAAFLATVGNWIVNDDPDLIVWGVPMLGVAAVGAYVIYERRERITSGN